MDHDVELEGEGLRLRRFRGDDPDDIAFLVRLADDPVSRQWSASLRSISDAATARAWVERRQGDASSYEWVVEDAGTGARVGRVGLHRFSPDGDIEVGYWTVPEARGTGVARRATRVVARFAHETLGESRVGLVHAVANPASCRAASAASFRHEGTHRGALDHGDGVKYDMHSHARLADDPWDPIALAVPAGGPPRLEGEGVLLRAWTSADAAALTSAASDPLIVEWNPFTVASAEDVERYVLRAVTGSDNLGWAVVDPADGTVLGGFSLHKIDSEHSCGEAGYWVVPAARGRAVGSRALAVVAEYAFTVLGLERLELFHAVDNPRSCRVAEKAGFGLESVRRKGYRYPDGELHDEHLHARLRDDG